MIVYVDDYVRAGPSNWWMADAIISTAEAAAERLNLAARVAQIQQRKAAFGAVLESVGAMKLSLMNRLEDSALPETRSVRKFESTRIMRLLRLPV